jgi:hypothetical protein
MKKSYGISLVTLVCLLGLGVTARAQEIDKVVVNVPFEFVAGGATLRAGEYGIVRVNPAVNDELAISGYDNRGAFLLPLVADGVTADKPSLSFEHVGGKYFLSKVRTSQHVYTLAPEREMVLLGQMNSPGVLSSSGTR